MYNVLIVDDEKMIRDDLCSLLAMEEEWELDLTTAASGIEAQSVLEERKIDIAIMDINMPQMSGLELYDIILERWPHCKMIFLTGYADFDYVYKVSKHARYVLKAEDDEKILEAVRETIAELENDLLLQHLSDFRQDREMQSIFYMRTLLLGELLEGYRPLNQLNQQLADEMLFDFAIDQKIYYVVLRHSIFLKDDYEEEKRNARMYYQLIEKYFLDFMHGSYLEYNRNGFLMILQPKQMQKEEHIVKMLAGAAELFQKALHKNLGTSTGVLVGEQAVLFETLVRKFSAIEDRMAWFAEDELSVEPIQKTPLEKEPLSDAKKQDLNQSVMKLEYYLEGMEKEKVLDTILTLQRELQGIRSMHDLFALELYCSISAKFIGWIKRLEVNEELAFRIGTMNLYNVSLHASWQDAFEYLYHVAEHVFEIKQQNVERQNEDVVNQVKRYITEHLAEDTSLHVLADQVHFSQEYLLRIFKKQEGITILQYINDMKLDMAKRLLTGSELSVKEIAEKLGFASQGYFGRFFRSKMGLSPKAYRDGQAR
ncbi:response regulator transcription factor [Fusicatenibacter sp.]